MIVLFITNTKMNVTGLCNRQSTKTKKKTLKILTITTHATEDALLVKMFNTIDIRGKGEIFSALIRDLLKLNLLPDFCVCVIDKLFLIVNFFLQVMYEILVQNLNFTGLRTM